MKIAEKLYFNCPPLFQNFLISAYGYKLYQKRYTGLYHDVRKEIEAAKAFSELKEKEYQEERLHQMVTYCANQIPYYQKLFAELSLHPNDITGLQDLKKLPILYKQTLLEQSHNFRPKNAPKPFMVQHTSGSTGTPLALEVDERTYKLAMALLVDHEETHGVPFGAKRATFAGRMLKSADDMKPPFSRFNRAENQRLFSSYHLDEKTFPHYQKELDQFQPLELIGYPSAIYDLATQYQNSNSKPGFQPKAIITNSETLLQWQREKIESVFDCQVYDYYGTAEYIIFAGQDSTGIYKTNPLIGITEVETEAGSVDTGSLIATTLTNKQMPLLRYNLGDTATLAHTGLPTVGTPGLKSINGRVDDYIETSDGRLIGRIDHIFKGVEGIQEAQVVQKQPGSATIRLVKNSTTELNESALISNCKQRLGDDFYVTLEQVQEIPRGRNGKFRSVLREK
ncbi:phenylacetate--CoA ligase family protein [Marinobacter salexigens]|uniref:phenylacetate--CoA ligase family protein n=1 Tax=Marinobacter salexigens TaxID=1925763 RepID=UPI000C293A4C|nr:phenylacetate--CoA ligase family protein [Marinobacter salexigens]